jgi:hypothetical protein
MRDTTGHLEEVNCVFCAAICFQVTREVVASSVILGIFANLLSLIQVFVETCHAAKAQ